eukprot:jgi/Tetstr1/442414/TSEL_030538.t1
MALQKLGVALRSPSRSQGNGAFHRLARLQLAKAGDCIVFSARTNASAFTKIMTESSFSHVGIVGPLPMSYGQPVLYESTKNTDGTVDLLHGSDNYVGTHCFDLEQRVMEFTGDVWILRLKRHLRQGNEAALCTFLHTHATARSGWTFAGAYRAGMDYLKNPALHAARRGLDAGSASPGVSDEEGQSDVEHPRMFCSKFVAHALKEAGVFFGDPSFMLPMDIVNLPCFRTPQLVKRLQAHPLLDAPNRWRSWVDSALAREMAEHQLPSLAARSSFRYACQAIPQGELETGMGSPCYAKQPAANDTYWSELACWSVDGAVRNAAYMDGDYSISDVKQYGVVITETL